MSKKTTLEQAYFHISNGGLSFSIIERTDTRKNCTIFPPDWGDTQKVIGEDPAKHLPTETRYNRSWRFKVTTNQFGATTEFSFPLVPLMVRWTLGALQRVLDRMDAPQDLLTDGYEHAFRELEYCSVSAEGGAKVDKYWPFKPVMSSNDSSS